MDVKAYKHVICGMEILSRAFTILFLQFELIFKVLAGITLTQFHMYTRDT
jgi:hypothetical protein